MHLNLPFIKAFDDCKNFLFVGVGGGYDCLGTIPLSHTLAEKGHTIHTIDLAQEIGRTGVQPVLAKIRSLVIHKDIECVVAVDCGVDALMRGDEQDAGTLLEDAVVLAALSQVKVSYKVLACVGFGTEAEEGLCHYRALENIAQLTSIGAFWGTCSLTADMDCFKIYKAAAEKAWFNKRKSHIHTRVIPAVLGQFGNQDLYQDVDARLCHTSDAEVFVNPFMGIYWFFDLMKVYERSLIAKDLIPTTTSTDALMVYRAMLPTLMTNRRQTIRLPL